MRYKIFWGGLDVDPSFYGARRSTKCGFSNINRDQQEIDLAKKLINQGIPVIGICRGAQLLNVVNGGTLLQHIEGHLGKHQIVTYDKQIINVNSTHHQMMMPSKRAHVLATAIEPTYGLNDPDDIHLTTVPEVYEVLYYPETKSMCIQYHPEGMSPHSEGVRWIKEEINKRMGIDVNFSDTNDLYFGHI